MAQIQVFTCSLYLTAFFLYTIGVFMKVARYHRVSTEQQNLARQTSATETYVEQEFDGADVEIYADADTGTNTDREDYQRLMADVEGGDVDVVVVKEMSRIARSVRDLMRTIDRLRDHDVALHFIDDPVTIEPEKQDPTQDLIIQVLGAVAEFEAKITQQRVREGIAVRMESEEYHHGPAPIGFKKNDGNLIETESYDRVCAVLEMVRDGELSQRKAAARLECSRPTIKRAIDDRAELYAL